MQAILKKITYRVLCNQLTGSVIYFFFHDNIPDLRWRGFKFKVPESSVNKQIAASVFWGFYESAEIRFVEKYLRKDINVIELGSSIGIVSSHIASKIGGGRHFITVETNPFLIDTIQSNIKRHQKPGSTFEVLNNAVGHSADEVMISITSNNTETRVMEIEAVTDGVKVKTVGFSDLVKKNGNENYSLVCDIEGSEVQIILYEKEALKQCNQLFIELHDSIYNNKHYSIQMLKDILVNTHGFQIMKQHGPVVYFAR
jgi:FkbM family methyltransferase